jgi:uncharacterized protein
LPAFRNEFATRVAEIIIWSVKMSQTVRRKASFLLICACFLMISFIVPVTASEQDRMAEEANANTVSVMSGTAASTYFRTGSDLAIVLDEEGKLRVLNVQGRGAIQNGYDVLLLRGVDIGFVTFDTLEVMKADERLRGVERQFAYIARLFNNDIQILAKTDITDIRQLAGQKVSFDIVGSGTNYSGRRIFEQLNIEVEGINIDQEAALAMLKGGEIAAIVSVAAKPVRFLADIKPDSGLHLVSIPYSDVLGENYSPITITDKDYPALVQAGETVQAVGVGTIMAVYNWKKGTDRYDRIARFVDAFFSKFDQFQKPGRHPKWKEVNLNATVPGWIRFQAAQEWLERNKVPAPAPAPEPAPVAAVRTTAPTQDDSKYVNAFETFLKNRSVDAAPASASAEQYDELYEQFLTFQKGR